MSSVEELLVRERIAEAHRTASRVRAVRVLRARRRAEVAARRAALLAERAEAVASELPAGGLVHA